MAGLISTGIWGFLCSMLPTGKRDEKGKMIMEEHFLSGFAGWGWKIWKTVAGFFRLEIDELVVRRTLTVFELLIQKIRAVKGAIAITQANGKIKTAVLSDDGTAYLITLEEDDMSFVEYDYFRCQEFNGGQKFYHVEIESVSDGAIRVPASEFAGSSLPSPGDEIVQFGNSSHDAKYAGRHSAIYMHADESGQPAIDVMFDIYEKAWTNCVKVRVGGDIPGTNGLKGFYCENGMIKCVATDGHTTYCLHPDGTAELGDGAAVFRPDKSGHIAGGAISWRWDETKGKYVCTMSDVVLTWDNLDDETKENLKGEPGKDGDGIPGKPGEDGKDGTDGTDGTDGKDANLLPWVDEWNNNRVYIDSLGEWIASPKMFCGTKNADGSLTGIAHGRDCIIIDGVKRTGIFALVDNEVVFELDPITKKYLFKGRVEANSGTFTGEVNADSGTIGGFEIANGRIGSEASASGEGGGLSITDDFLRVGGTNGHVMIGKDVIPSTAGGAFTATGRITNCHPNTGSAWGFDTANYGLFINVSGGTRNYGIHSDAPLIASAFINTQIGYVTFGTGSYEIDFTRYSTFVVNATTNVSVNLPNEAALAKMFSLSSLPSGFGFVFKFIADVSAPDMRLLGIINGNGDVEDILFRDGDTVDILCYKRTYSSAISYRLAGTNW